MIGVGVGFGTCGGTWRIRAIDNSVEIILSILNGTELLYPVPDLVVQG
jgi:hypothetical protein